MIKVMIVMVAMIAIVQVVAVIKEKSELVRMKAVVIPKKKGRNEKRSIANILKRKTRREKRRRNLKEEIAQLNIKRVKEEIAQLNIKRERIVQQVMIKRKKKDVIRHRLIDDNRLKDVVDQD